MGRRRRFWRPSFVRRRWRARSRRPNESLAIMGRCLARAARGIASVIGSLVGEPKDPRTVVNTDDSLGRSRGSLFDLARSAIVAGHAGRIVSSEWSKLDGPTESREETLFPGLDSDHLTAEEWMSLYGIEDGMEEDILGSGTPFLCLYLLGWHFGQHWTGWILALIPLASCWVMSVLLASTSDHASIALLVDDIFLLAASSVCFYFRVHVRTPERFPISAELFVALLLETLLANTLVGLGRGTETLARELVFLPNRRILARGLKLMVTVVGWQLLRAAAQDRQSAVLRKMNMGNRARGRRPPGAEPKVYVVCGYLMKIMERSRDLRVTGLSTAELEQLASMIHLYGYENVARYVRFYASRSTPVGTFELLAALCSRLRSRCRRRRKWGGGLPRSWGRRKRARVTPTLGPSVSPAV